MKEEKEKDETEYRYDLEDVANTSFKKVNEVIGNFYKIGNAGYVEVLDYMGSDASIVESARQSYNMGTAKLDETKIKTMIDSMTKNGHTSPFEQAIIKFKFKMPIFVARQFLRHRTASLNESSLRYTINKNETWRPTENTYELREGKFELDIPKSKIDEIFNKIDEDTSKAYMELVKGKVPREISRANLTLGTYTEFVWNMDLNNLKHLLKLRMDSHAQREIFEYAVAIYMLTYPIFPVTMEAFKNYVFLADNVSLEDFKDQTKLDVIQNRIKTRWDEVQNEMCYLSDPSNNGRHSF